MTDLFQYAEAHPQNWRHSDPPTSKAAGLSTQSFKADHHAAILSVLRRSAEPLAAEQISDVLAYDAVRGGVFLDYVAVGKRTSELIDAGLIERAAETHKNRSGRCAFKLRIKQPQFATAGDSTPARL